MAVGHEKQLDRLATHVGRGRARPVLVLEGEVGDRERKAACRWPSAFHRFCDQLTVIINRQLVRERRLDHTDDEEGELPALAKNTHPKPGTS